MSVVKVKTTASITLNMPESAVAGTNKSGLPLAGKFMISCTDPVSGLKVKTGEMDYTTSATSIKEAINGAIPFLVDNVDVIQSYKYTHD